MTQITSNTITELTQFAEIGRGRAHRLCWTADGNQLVVAASTGVYLYDKTDWETPRFYPADKDLYQVAVSADGRFIAAGSTQGTIHIWHLPTHTLLTTFLVPDMSAKAQVRGLAFSPQGDRLAIGGSNGVAHIYKIITDAVTANIEFIHQHPLLGSNTLIESLSFSPDGGRVVGCDYNGNVLVWQSDTGELEQSKNLTLGSIHTACFIDDSQTVLFGGNQGELYVWQLSNDEVKHIPPPKKAYLGRVTAVSVMGNGAKVLSASQGGALILTSVASLTYNRISYPSAPASNTVGQPIISLAVTPNQSHIAGLITGGRIFVLEQGGTQEQTVIDAHHHSVRGLAFTPNNSIFIGQGITIGHPTQWNIEKNRVEHILTHPTDELYGVYGMGLSEDGEMLAASCHDGHTVDLWHAPSKAYRLGLRANGHDVKQITFSANGELLGALSHGLQVWNSKTGEELYTVKGDDTAGFAFFPDGKRGILVDTETAYLWRTATGEIIAEHPLSDDENYIEDITLSNSGKWLALATEWSIELIDTTTWEAVFTIEEPDPYPETFLFSKDDSLLIVGCTDGTIQFWSLPDGKLCHQIVHPYQLTTLARSANGELLASGSREGTVRLWRIENNSNQPFS